MLYLYKIRFYNLFQKCTRYEQSFIFQRYTFDLNILQEYVEVNAEFRRFKSDLLYRSQKENKGYISINMRGRQRNRGFRYPEKLRILDIVFDRFSIERNLPEYFPHNDIKNNFSIATHYTGFK